MITKICTDIDQSKKLAEILPIESADMWYWEWPTAPKYNNYEHPMFHKGDDIVNVPCWSLAALLDALENEIDGEEGETYQLNIEKDGTWWNIWYREKYDEANPIETESTENLVDACVEMIVKLKEKNLL